MGVFCAVMAISVSSVTKAAAGEPLARITKALFVEPFGRLDGILWFSSLVAAPIVEGLLFPFLWLLVSKVSSNRVKLGVYLSIVAFAGFALHGLSRAALGRAASFAGLGALFAYRKLRDEKAYRAVVVAHLVWNFTSLVMIAAIGGSAHR